MKDLRMLPRWKQSETLPLVELKACTLGTENIQLYNCISEYMSAEPFDSNADNHPPFYRIQGQICTEENVAPRLMLEP